jgi:hypothetical protein
MRGCRAATTVVVGRLPGHDLYRMTGHYQSGHTNRLYVNGMGIHYPHQSLIKKYLSFTDIASNGIVYIQMEWHFLDPYNCVPLYFVI